MRRRKEELALNDSKRRAALGACQRIWLTWVTLVSVAGPVHQRKNLVCFVFKREPLTLLFRGNRSPACWSVFAGRAGLHHGFGKVLQRFAFRAFANHREWVDAPTRQGAGFGARCFPPTIRGGGRAIPRVQPQPKNRDRERFPQPLMDEIFEGPGGVGLQQGGIGRLF